MFAMRKVCYENATVLRIICDIIVLLFNQPGLIQKSSNTTIRAVTSTSDTEEKSQYTENTKMSSS